MLRMSPKWFFPLLTLVLLLAACGPDEAPADAAPPAEDRQEAVRPLELDDLKALLPKRLLGMERTEYSANKTGAFGFNVSVASAVYEEGETRLEVVFTDAGRFTQAVSGLANWTKFEVDKEDQNGYERTTEIEGYRAYEKYDRTRRHGELSLLIGDRFVVAIKGDEMKERDFRRVVRRLDLEELEP